MAKIHLDRLKRRYGYSGEPYRNLVQNILLQNSENISRKVGKISQENWTKAMQKMGKDYHRFVVPDMTAVLPKRAVFTLKAAERGRLISDSLRDAMTKNLRETMNQFTPVTGEARYIIRRGEKAGRINPKLIKEFEQKISQTFTNYTRRDKRLGMPTNIHTIAVTEMRSNVNNMKNRYKEEMQYRNPALQFKKRWIHNSSLSKEPRPGHVRMDGKTVPYDSSFVVPIYKKVRKRWFWVGQILMAHPHDPQAPAGEVIGCNCDFEVIARKRQK